MFRLSFLTMILCVSLAVSAKLTLGSVITDNMVLQQNADVRLWGTADAGAVVNVKASWGAQATTTADKQGKWLLTLKTPKASYNEHTLEFTTSNQNPTAKNLQPTTHNLQTKLNSSLLITGVLIGEVWLASGQSNMEMPLKGFAGCCVKDGHLDAMRAHAESPYVRMYKVELSQAFTRRDTCNGKWLTPTYQNALEYSATAYYFASSLSNALGIPVGIVNCSFGGTRVESWSSPELCMQYPDVPQDSLTVFNDPKWASYERPLVTYNAMFWPIRQYTYHGIVWYQGCSNVTTYHTYAERLANMVKLWRSDLALGDIPFYQVQIAPYAYGPTGNETGAAFLREQQFNACTLIPNSDIVSTNDLVEPFERHNIHPREKRTAGMRLAMLALGKTYGMKGIPCSGPRYDAEKFRIIGDTAVVGFITNQYGICRNYDIQGFEIAGSDRKFHTATADFRWRTNEIYLTSPEVKHPVAVRYCFKDFQKGNVIGGGELPLFPFRTDNWE